tara:strand:+ start:844 stop:1467 length:624 start_codon:yes stop_codon:yes gene_type:complete
MFFEPTDYNNVGLVHNPLKAIVAPRPIGWISSRGKDGSVNLAPYSFFNAVSEDPAIVMFSVQASGPDQQKDSLRNVIETHAFVVNIVGAAQLQAMNISSGDYPYAENEFITAGLEMLPSKTVDVPFVGNVPAALECRLLQTIKLPANKHGAHYTAVLGTVTGIFVDESVVVDGKINYKLLAPVARMGYRDYANINDFFELGRPVVKD